MYNEGMEPIEIHDAIEIDTKSYKYIAYDKFDKFNPVQSAILPYVSQDLNAVISASTSSGKTVIAEFFIANSVYQNNKKVIYISPLRALTSEKYYEWKNKFSDKTIGFFTENDGKINDSFDVGLFTIEGFCHKFINKPGIFVDVDTVIVDEAHLLGAEGRGHVLEFCTMLAAKAINTKIILLSGTLENGKKISSWLSTLNNKQTIYLSSKYRPVPLQIHYRKYDEDFYEDGVPTDLLSSILLLVKKHDKDKFIVFVHSKNLGKKLKAFFKRKQFDCEFHHADLKSNERNKIEENFKSGDLRILIATSTLAAGVNLPARRVIIAGVQRGKQLVEKSEIMQMVGRAGRKGIDPEGDAYIYLPERKTFLSTELKKIDPVKSTMLEMDKNLEYKNLYFYVMALMNLKQYNLGMFKFIKECFAVFDGKKIDEDKFKTVLTVLYNYNLIDLENKVPKVSKYGNLSLIYFIHPLDIFHYKVSFSKLIKSGDMNDYLVSHVLGTTYSNKDVFISKEEKLFCSKYEEKLKSLIGTSYYDQAAVKISCAYFYMMNGYSLGPLSYLRDKIIKDLGRLSSCLSLLSKISGWGKDEFFRTLSKRIMYGVKPELFGLIEIRGIGKVRAEKLYNAGLKNKEDIIKNIDKASAICGINASVLIESCYLIQKNHQDTQS